eukprot:TRINITY_DN9003_c0_g1_i2.p1 TRINITY_DN9003_c0_g1~~TRINITY_DN9003_c0_g1_i2.p1  ORF type:complete len:277 (+),score=63.88 TRINITY_DN9003_c0_g1_i2:61-831(+)
MCIRDSINAEYMGKCESLKQSNRQYVVEYALMSGEPLVYGYWNMRGAGQPLVFLMEYLGIKYQEKRYKTDDYADWFKRDRVALKTPFPNLPYIKDGNFELAESEAISLYLCLKAGRPELVKRPTYVEQAKYIETRSQVMKLRKRFMFLMADTDEYETKRETVYQEEIKPGLRQLNEHLKGKTYLEKDITYVDFVFFEFLELMRRVEGNSFLKEFENIEKYHEEMRSIPQIASYLSSDRFIHKKFMPHFILNARFQY